jgi:hypothetical protein
VDWFKSQFPKHKKPAIDRQDCLAVYCWSEYYKDLLALILKIFAPQFSVNLNHFRNCMRNIFLCFPCFSNVFNWEYEIWQYEYEKLIMKLVNSWEFLDWTWNKLKSCKVYFKEIKKSSFLLLNLTWVINATFPWSFVSDL